MKEKYYAKSLVLFNKIMSDNFFIIMKFIIDTSNQILLKSLNQTEFNAFNAYLDKKIITQLNCQLSTSHGRKSGRPRLRWFDDIEKDLIILKIINWKH